MITEIAYFEYSTGKHELLAWTDDNKMIKRTADKVGKLYNRTPIEVRTALREMTLYKTRESANVKGEWYKRG